mgnify:FL=1
MRYLKRFESFITEAETAPAPAPTKPKTEPGPNPDKKPRPGPIRRDKPAVKPDPKALKKASANDVAKKFIQELHKKGDSVKNYIK